VGRILCRKVKALSFFVERKKTKFQTISLLIRETSSIMNAHCKPNRVKMSPTTKVKLTKVPYSQSDGQIIKG